LTLDIIGNLYVADSRNSTIRKVTPEGAVTTIVDTTAGLNGPSGVALDREGNLYVTDAGNDTILKITFPHPAILNPRMVPSAGTGSQLFSFTVTGLQNRVVVVEASTDLVNWLAISTNTLSGPLTLSDAQSGNYPIRFYRVLAPSE
jgi:DNA-binding beta-propeller fold protein YncE